MQTFSTNLPSTIPPGPYPPDVWLLLAVLLLVVPVDVLLYVSLVPVMYTMAINTTLKQHTCRNSMVAMK